MATKSKSRAANASKKPKSKPAAKPVVQQRPPVVKPLPPYVAAPVPSNSLTQISYRPNNTNLQIFATALTQSLLSKSNASVRLDTAQVYSDCYATVQRVLAAALEQAAVPPVNPVTRALAVVFFAINSAKMSDEMPNGTRYQFAPEKTGYVALPPASQFGVVGPTIDSNGFGILETYTPGSIDEQNASWQEVMSSTTHIEKWYQGHNEPPRESMGVSQFSTILNGIVGGARTFVGENAICNSFVPIRFPVLAGLGLLESSNSAVRGQFNTPLYGTPQNYAGLMCSQWRPDLRIRIQPKKVDVRDFVAQTVGLMAGVNEQSVKLGGPPVFPSSDATFLVAHILNVIATSQAEYFPMTAGLVTDEPMAGYSLPAGAAYPPRDAMSSSSLQFFTLVVETLRRMSAITTMVLDEGGRTIKLLLVPVFVIYGNLITYTASVLEYAGIANANVGANIDPTRWYNTLTNNYLTYATRMEGGSWGTYYSAFLQNITNAAIFSTFSQATPLKEPGLNLIHYSRLEISAEAALATVNEALGSITIGSRNGKRLQEMRKHIETSMARRNSVELVAGPPLNIGTPVIGTFSYSMLGDTSANFMALPIPRTRILLGLDVSAASAATQQVPALRQITSNNTPGANDPSIQMYLFARSCAQSQAKDTPPNETMTILANRSAKGLGGAVDVVGSTADLARALYLAAGGKNVKKYDAVAKPVTKSVKTLTKPLTRKINAVLA